MDPQDIEANIKSLLGLNLGGEVSQGTAAPDNAGPPLTRPPLHNGNILEYRSLWSEVQF